MELFQAGYYLGGHRKWDLMKAVGEAAATNLTVTRNSMKQKLTAGEMKHL